MDREKLRATRSFLDTKTFEGAQVAYFWRQLEPGKDEYGFGLIREDLAFLARRGKKLWVQIQDVTFSERRIPVPCKPRQNSSLTSRTSARPFNR